MRSFRLALAFLVVGASACSLALDTDALKKGTGGAGGSGGSGGTGGTLDGGADAGLACNSDLDCQPIEAVNGCNRYQCGPNKTCLPSVPHTGLGVVSIAGNKAETADDADDFGMPVLVADGTDLVLAAWKKDGPTTNIVIRKYDEDRPDLAALDAELNAITMGRFESVASSPALIVRGVPRKLRMLGAAKLTGVATTGMYQLDVDVATLRLSATQPMKADVGVVGYDTNPRGPAPRFLVPLVGEPAGIWIQQGKLFGFDASGGGELFGTKRVIGFAPLAANAGLHAALETTELGSTDDQGQTELWTRGSPSLTSLINDQPGARRRGVATTATGAEGAGGPLNFVVWSFEKAGSASLFYAAAGCDANSCASIGSPAGTGDVILPATDPAVASARVGTTTERDLAVTFELSGPDPNRPGMMSTAIVGGLSRLGPNPDGGTLASTAINPPSFIVAYTAQGSAALSPSAVTVTSGGTMMVAWVERAGGKASLMTRRFRVKTCP